MDVRQYVGVILYVVCLENYYSYSCCITRKPLSSSIILYDDNIIAQHHHTNNNPSFHPKSTQILRGWLLHRLFQEKQASWRRHILLQHRDILDRDIPRRKKTRPRSHDVRKWYHSDWKLVRWAYGEGGGV